MKSVYIFVQESCERRLLDAKRLKNFFTKNNYKIANSASDADIIFFITCGFLTKIIDDSLKNIKVPVMTVVGSNEVLKGDKTLIAQLVPDACHFQIQGKNHLTMVRDPKFHMVGKAFLNYVNRK